MIYEVCIDCSGNYMNVMNEFNNSIYVIVHVQM